MAKVNINLRKDAVGDPAIKFEHENGDYLDIRVELGAEIEGDEFDGDDAEGIKDEIRQLVFGHLMQVSGAMLQGQFGEDDSS